MRRHGLPLIPGVRAVLAGLLAGVLPGAAVAAQSLTLVARDAPPVAVVAGMSYATEPLAGGLGFALTGAPGTATSFVIETLALPAALVRADGVSLPVASWSMRASAEGSAEVSFAPPPPAGTSFEAPLGQLDLALGFEVTTIPGQAPGRYEGEVLLTAAAPGSHPDPVSASALLAIDVMAPLQVSTEPMDIGVVVSGSPRRVEPGDANAAQILIVGEPSAAVSLEFAVVPDRLLGAGGASLPLQASLLAGPGATAPCASGTPVPVEAGARLDFVLPAGTGEAWLVCLGAEVNPEPAQPPGVYAATVVVTVHYVGS